MHMLIIINLFKFFKSLRRINPIMTTYQSYSSRYSKSRERKIQSTSPQRSTHQEHKKLIDNKHQNVDNQLGNVVAKLNDRVDGIDIKITSLTNIIKLLQKYTQTKDQQYEKQKQNQEFRYSIGKRVENIQSLELNSKIRQFQVLSQKVKSEIAAIQSIRVNFAKEQTQKKCLTKSDHIKTPINSIQVYQQSTNFNELYAMIGSTENSLRQQMNKKIEICMNYFKKTIEHIDSQKQGRMASPKTVNSMNSVMLQQQLHNLTLTVNKLESDFIRNKIVGDKRLEQILSYVGEIKKKSINRNHKDGTRRSRSRSRSVSGNQSELMRTAAKQGEDKSQKSSVSKRSKSISRNKNTVSHSEHAIKNTERLDYQKKQKQTELKQALRRKKQNQDKLKMKR